MSIFSKQVSPEKEQAAMVLMIDHLDKIYSNKSGDEYKMHGDITLSPVYDLLQRTIADLNTIKNVSRSEIDDLKKMFNALHRPNFKKIVTKYIAEKKSDCVIMTATFTVAYRVLIAELSRIYTSTEATESGFVYKPDQYSKQNSLSRFIRNFNVRIDSELNKSVRAATKSTGVGDKFKMEAFVGSSAAVAKFAGEKLAKIGPFFKEFGAWCRMLFPDVSVLNPVSWFSNKLSAKYDAQVDKYHDLAKMYLETKKAYDEYMEKPAFRRNKKVEENYKKMIKTYNIKMLNAKVAIRDFDQRSIKATIEEAKREEEMLQKSGGGIPVEEVKEPKSDTKEKTSTSTTTSSKPPAKNDDPFDF